MYGCLQAVMEFGLSRGVLAKPEDSAAVYVAWGAGCRVPLGKP
jgi:hypothetical protein